MVSIELHARLRRSPLSRWLIELQTWGDHLRWKYSGGEKQVLSAYGKRRVILDALSSRDLRTVIETGTFLGDTAHFLASRGVRVISVEVDGRLAALARARFANSANVKIVEGDSGKLLPELIAGLEKPALFFLDGHYSGGVTGKGEQETPVVKEVEAVLAGAPTGSFVIIDDARCFGLLPDYPPLGEFLTTLRNRGVGDAVVKDDSIRFSVPLRGTA